MKRHTVRKIKIIRSTCYVTNEGYYHTYGCSFHGEQQSTFVKSQIRMVWITKIKLNLATLIEKHKKK